MEIYGTFENVIYKDYYSGKTLFTIRCHEKGLPRNNIGAVICFGVIQDCMYGLPLKLNGEISEYHGKKEFFVQSYSLFSTEYNIIIDFLKKNFNNIGEKTAEKIIEISNNDIFSFVKKPNAANILADNISRFSINDAMRYVNSVRNIISYKDIFEYFSTIGGNYFYTTLILKEFPDITIEEFKNNPYHYGKCVNIPFYICDNSAFLSNIKPDDEKRIRMMITESIQKDINNGNTYITLNILYRKIEYLCNNSKYSYKPTKARILLELLKFNNIVIEKGENAKVYLKKIWLQEKNCVDEYYRICNTSEKFPFHEKYIKNVERECNIKYSEEQRNAFNLLKSSGIKIVCGLPGTGKTTFCNGLLKIYQKMFPENKIIKLCAPTGRAARRLSESTNMNASTVHSTLDITPYEGRDDMLDSIQENPADFFLVDEISMVDIMLFECLLRAARNGALIVLVGDENQLSSVGPGNVLHDMINSGIIETYKLNKIFRQSENSAILVNSRRINDGRDDLIFNEEFEIIKEDDEKKINEIIKEKYRKYFDKQNPFGVQELSPVKSTDIGVENINQELQSELNHNKSFIWFGKNKFLINDKVMFIENNKKRGFCNGDIGIVTSICDDKMEVYVNDEYIPLGLTDMNKITLAYANTIHKSQGSEYDVVIILLPENPSGMLQRNLLYTAVTRAKKKVILIYQEDALKKCIQCTDNMKRRTNLTHRLQRKNIEYIKL